MLGPSQGSSSSLHSSSAVYVLWLLLDSWHVCVVVSERWRQVVHRPPSLPSQLRVPKVDLSCLFAIFGNANKKKVVEAETAKS